MLIELVVNDGVTMYEATVTTPLIVVSVLGRTHLEALKNCLVQFNSMCYYDCAYG
jgi:hypothetical protein